MPLSLLKTRNQAKNSLRFAEFSYIFPLTEGDSAVHGDRAETKTDDVLPQALVCQGEKGEHIRGVLPHGAAFFQTEPGSSG